MRRFFFFLLLLLCLACTSTPASESVAPVWQSLLEPSGKSDLAAVRALPPTRWKTESGSMIAYGFSSGQVWVKTRFYAEKADKYVLELANPQLDHATLYLLRQDGKLEIFPGGFAREHEPSELDDYHHQIYEFHLNAGEAVTLFLQASATRSLILWPRLTTDTRFAHQGLVERFWIGLFAGLFVALSVYCLMVWRAAKDRNFLDYVLFLIANGLLQMQLLGILHEFFLYRFPVLMDACNTLLSVLVFVAMIRFTSSFLDLHHYSQRSDRLLRVCAWLSYGLLGVYIIGGSRWSIPLANLMGVVIIAIGLSIGFIVWSRGNRPARFFIMAQAVLGVGGVCYVLIRFNLIPAVPLTVFSFQVSSALEVLLTAIALADKINILQRERVKAQNERLAVERRMVEALRESEAMLEHRVKERTLQLEEALNQQCKQGEVLWQTNQQLVNLNEERSAILSIAAHDLKNPTAAIMSYVDLMVDHWDEYDGGKKLKRLASIRGLAQLIHEIIRNLLDMNAIESGSYTLNPVLFDPRELCSALIEEYRDRAEAKSIGLHLEVQPGVQVCADRSALHQVLDNLLSNAIKYSLPGMNVFMNVSEKRGMTEICVRDEGPGISAEDQTKLYRKFTRLSARPTGGEHSTGLGLSIVKQIVEASGGSVYCESRLGEGASFCVRLPAAPQLDSDDGSLAQ